MTAAALAVSMPAAAPAKHHKHCVKYKTFHRHGKTYKRCVKFK